MDVQLRQRIGMALAGALAGLSLHFLVEIHRAALLPDRAALALIAFAAVFFTALLGMAGPLGLRRAAPGALVLALVVAGLMAMASLRFDPAAELLRTAIPVLSGLVLVLVPMPFLIAAQGGNWRDYPTLFNESWTIVVRYGAASLFVGVVFLLLMLSDRLLDMVGLPVIGQLMDDRGMRLVLIGVTLGLGMALMSELADLISPYLVLRLLRLLLPVVLVVLVVFLLALPFRGLDQVFSRLSAATVLLVMAGMAVLLVTAVIDQTEEEAAQGAFLRRAAQLLALLVIIPASLGAWAVWQRVQQYGWTPDRVFAATVAFLALGYGLVYLGAVLAGRGWEARIRSGNIGMALVLIAVAATLLTPLVNPERISAQSQLARYDAGQVSAAELDIASLARWGRAGRATLDQLSIRAQEPGQEALAKRLAGWQLGRHPEKSRDTAALRAELAALMPLGLAVGTATRDAVFEAQDAPTLERWLAACNTPLPEGGSGCAMLVADFWPDTQGDEALVILRSPEGFMEYLGYAAEDGRMLPRSVIAIGAPLPDLAEGEALLREVQSVGHEAITPAPLNALQLEGRSLLLLP